MNKRKLMLVAVALCMVAILGFGGTLAYLTDTDHAKNTFTLGNVEIELHETDVEGNAFENGQVLLPGIKNHVDKVVRVENTGDNDAYMWVELLIPASLDKVGNASENILHFNPCDTYLKDGVETPLHSSEATGLTKVATTIETYMGHVTLDDVTYNVYREHIENDTAKETGEFTYALLTQVYVDAGCDQCNEGHENCYVKGENHYQGPWQILVRAYGIQADGFGSIDEAMTAYYAQYPSDAE